jgi:RNA polymerase sigma factor (sigma-70 family)
LSNVEASRSRSRLRLLGRPADRAFEQLYSEHAGEVYQYTLALLANPADAEDATQTTFLNAYRAFQRGERPQKPHNWLIAIAHNVCRMRWRQAGSRPREVALEEAPEPVAHEHDHERPNLDEVLTALAGLSFNQRAALVMRELEGRSYQEIAEVLGLSTSAVEALLFRARRRLQVDRKSLGVITSVPLPGSLTSFVGGGGGVVAVGGTAVGTDLVLKAAAIVAAGAVTAGAGYKGVDIVATNLSASRPQQYARAPAVTKQRTDASATARVGVRRSARPSTPRRVTVGPGVSPQAPASTPTPAQPSATSATGLVATTTAAAPVPQLPAAQLPSLPPAPVPVPTPTVPQVPVTVPNSTVPQLPVAAPTPTVPQLPVTVPTPQLPPLPPLPSIPPK